MGKRATKAQIAARINRIKLFLAQGEDTGAILRYAAEQWGVKSRQTETYIARAREALQTDFEALRPYALAEALASRRELRRKMKAAGDYRGVLYTLEDEAKLLGLYAPTRSEWTGKNGQPLFPAMPDFASMDAEELDDEIRGLLEQVGAKGPGTPGPSFVDEAPEG